MEQKDIKRLIKALIGVGLLLLLILIIKPQNYIKIPHKDTISESPIELVGGSGERIYLRFGTIYAFKDDPEKEYSVVVITFHVTQKQLERMIFFNTPEEAEIAGYKPSENFAKNYDCVKQGKDLFECPEINSE